jgi:hypothetical protein
MSAGSGLGLAAVAQALDRNVAVQLGEHPEDLTQRRHWLRCPMGRRFGAAAP